MTGPIILPTDFSEHSAVALSWAHKISVLFDAPIHCVYVMREAGMYPGTEFVPAAFISADDMAQQVNEEMARFSAKHELGSDTKAVVLIGTPFVEIVRYARAQDAAMIVMSTHGYGGLKHVLLGSTTEAVVRKASCPVLSVPASEDEFEMP